MQQMTTAERAGLVALRTGIERYQAKQQMIAELLETAEAVLSGADPCTLGGPVAALRRLPSFALIQEAA